MHFRLLLITPVLCLTASFTRAEVKLPGIFGDHMVLQQEATLPIWGTANPGEKITVTVGGETGSATADPNGKWQIKLPPLPNGTASTTMTVAGKNTLTFSDVLVGEVWLCSGQSNMAFEMTYAHNAATEIPQATNPQLRFFRVKSTVSPEPEADVSGTWTLCTPENAPKFSAVGYFFGRALQTALNRPVGLIESYWGGTPIQSWTSAEVEKEFLPPSPVKDDEAARIAEYRKVKADYPAQLAAYETTLETWKRDVDTPYQAALQKWNTDAKAAKTAGQPEPPRPQPSAPKPKTPPDPGGNYWAPTRLYNGMIAPLMPFAIKGVLWYQGESDAGLGPRYKVRFEHMIADWRKGWGEGDFPFLFVQLASIDPTKYGGNVTWTYVREAQQQTLEVPHTGLATAIDLGDYHYPSAIHPRDKLDVGLRLALAARHIAYGQDIVYSGPVCDTFKLEGNSIRVTFTQSGGGLVIGKPPYLDPQAAPWPVDKLTGFEIAGPDGNYVPADAKIDGASVLVSSPQVTQPVYVRYAWSDVVETNLYNKEGLPALPFRTDNQPMPTKSDVKPANMPPVNPAPIN